VQPVRAVAHVSFGRLAISLVVLPFDMMLTAKKTLHDFSMRF
jgi:hypothetical protein